MSVKKPTSISLKWWKKYVPNSLPKNKVIEDNLKAIEKFPSSLAHEQVRALYGKHSVIEASQLCKPISAQCNALLDELKRFRAVVTKDKKSHKEFLEAIDVMIHLVNDDMTKVKEEIIAQTAEAQKGISGKLSDQKDLEKKEEKIVKAIENAEQKAIKLSGILARFKQALPNASDPDALQKIIGHSRWAEPQLKTMLRDQMAVLKKEKVAMPNAQDALDSLTLQVKSAIVDCRQLDKMLVQKCVQEFGDAKGKKLFVSAEAKPIKL